MRVAVLMGGMSAERDVSLQTGRAIAEALVSLGHEAVEVDVGPDLPLALDEQKPEVAFLALHGRGGEDGSVQGVLEIMRIPYTGCGVLASAVTMDKVVTKEVLSCHNVPLAEDIVVGRGNDLGKAVQDVDRFLSYPVMVKPASEGSSIAVTEVHEQQQLREALRRALDSDYRALIERRIRGRLLTVGIIGAEQRVLPVLEIVPREGFYDYRAKYEPGFTSYEVPARISDELSRRAQDISLESFRILGCEGISRIDLMLEDHTDEIYVLEVNTIPGMTATSLIPKAARAAGMDFEEVVSTVLKAARLKIELAGVDAR